jgi:hypothetical protein
MLFEKDPLYVFGQSVNVGIHRSGVDAKIMEASFALAEAFALNFDLE